MSLIMREADSIMMEADSIMMEAESRPSDALEAPLAGKLRRSSRFRSSETMSSKMKEAESRPSDALEAPLAGKLRRSLRFRSSETMSSKLKEAESRPSDALEAPLAGKLRGSSRFSLADSPSKSKSTPPQLHSADPSLSNQVYLFFWHSYSPVMYTLYKINIPRHLPPPSAKASQDLKLRPLCPVLTLKTGEYPDRMCCVQLGSKLYFFGGEFNITNPYIDEDVIKELNPKRDVFPPDVYFLDLAKQKNTSLKLSFRKPMNSGKASPQAFVADGKIYVIGSTIQMNIIDKSKLKDLDLKNFFYFEFYNPEDDTWEKLSDPPIRDMNTKWVGHAVVGKTALLVAWQRGKECVYFFDLVTHQWKKYASLPSYPGNFSGRIEYVEDTIYGCYGNTIAAIAPLAAKAEEEDEEDEIEEEEEEEEEEDEIEEDEKEEEIEKIRLLEHHGLHLVSKEMGMDAIFNVPLQLQSSSSLLHLGNRYFCYVKTGMPPQMNGIDHAIEDDKRRFISIVIFQALGKTYKEHGTRLFSAKFLHSAHYVVNNPFPSEGFIDGFFSPGLVHLDPSVYLDPSLSDTGDFFFFSPELKICEKPQAPSKPAIELTCDQSSHSVVEGHKRRMRWTPELHELFVEAVSKLEAAGKATPKGILKLMNVGGLTINHVKCHLQKFQEGRRKRSLSILKENN